MADKQAPTILVVEDDTFLASLLNVRLKKEHFNVVEAADGTDALAKIKTMHPDLVLLDLILPQKNGFEVLQEVSQDPQLEKLPIIVISNLGQESDIERGKSLGAIAYYVKARLSIDDLIDKVKDFLAESKK